MATLTKGTWVLIADGQKALFLRNDLDAINPDLNVVRLEQQENPATHDQGTHPPGRRADSGAGQRSAMEDTDWHALAKDRFADDMADLLYKYAHKDAFKRIVLVAPSRVLGELRDKLHKEVAARVVAELPKDLTNHPLDKVEKLLKAELDPNL
ncbi:baeRF12 domain-containing protein [Roseovarius salis]|uniref:baeRF12 domain-containing protein n=1 Tax=Roseovarius salis TaxID=3376063 RepID=UPI0037C878FF